MKSLMEGSEPTLLGGARRKLGKSGRKARKSRRKMTKKQMQRKRR